MREACASATPSSDPLAGFELDALLEGAARLRPSRLALQDDWSALTFGEAQSQAQAVALALRDAELRTGECVLVAAGAPASGVAALAGALGAGLNAAIAPAWASPDQAARAAVGCGASAIVVVQAPGLSEVESWLAAAAAAPTVRLVCTFGGARADGALPLSTEANAPALASTARARELTISTFGEDGSCVPHKQRTLVAAALDLISRARIGMSRPIYSTLPPTSFAGLVAGPVTALLVGAPLRWRLPFRTESFLAEIDELAPAHLIAPLPLLPILREAGLATPNRLASAIFVTRRRNWSEASAADKSSADEICKNLPVVDLYAFGEYAAAPESRGPDGFAVAPAQEPHYLSFDETRMLALDWSNDGASRRLEGAASSSG